MHVALGALLIAEGAWVVLQGRLGATWEIGFYGAPHPSSIAILLAGLLACGLGAAAIWFGGCYHFRIGDGHGVMVTALLMMCLVPEPVSWMLLAGSILVVVERWRTVARRRQG